METLSRNVQDDTSLAKPPVRTLKLKEGIDESSVDNAVLKRIIEEVRDSEVKNYNHDRYDRIYHRHNRGN